MSDDKDSIRPHTRILDNDEVEHNNKRKVKRSDLRTLTVKGYNENKYGFDSKLTQMSRKRTRQFNKSKTKSPNSPLVTSDIPTSLKQGLRANYIDFNVDKSIGLSSPIIKVDNRYKEQMKDIGVVPEVESDRNFQISVYDLLYGLQTGALGNSTRSRKALFREVMDFNSVQDEHYMQKYLVYLELRNNNYIVMDGMPYGTTFAIVEPMPDEVKEELIRISEENPEMVGSNPRSKFSVMAAGIVDVITDDMDNKEAIKGQHMASKADVRYFLASVDDEEYVDDKVVGGEVSLYLMRKDRLQKEFRSRGERKTLIVSDVEPFEIKE